MTVKQLFNFLTVFGRRSLPMAAPDREQLKIELQQVNQQINQQTQMRSMEVCMLSNRQQDLQRSEKC